MASQPALTDSVASPKSEMALHQLKSLLIPKMPVTRVRDEAIIKASGPFCPFAFNATVADHA